MSAADYNRAISDCAWIIAEAAVRAAAKPLESPLHRRMIVEAMVVIADEITALKMVTETAQ